MVRPEMVIVLLGPTDFVAKTPAALEVERVTASVEITPTSAAEPFTKSDVAFVVPS